VRMIRGKSSWKRPRVKRDFIEIFASPLSGN
jgi:hypothetical protein